jgi:hypothetical protein
MIMQIASRGVSPLLNKTTNGVDLPQGAVNIGIVIDSSGSMSTVSGELLGFLKQLGDELLGSVKKEVWAQSAQVRVSAFGPGGLTELSNLGPITKDTIPKSIALGGNNSVI